MKVIDITEKLNFEERPVLVIKGTKYPVNNDALSMLKVMQMTEHGFQANTMAELYDIIFDEETRNKIDNLKLDILDFQTVITTAIQLASSEEETLGEQ